MKPFPIFLMLLGVPVALPAQENSTPQTGAVPGETGIHGPIADGTVPEPPPPVVPPDFEVIRSVTKRVEVSESPELPDLPPVEGTINLTVQQVQNPGLPPLERPFPPLLGLSGPVVQEQIQEAQEGVRETKILLVSASVYAHRKTLLKVHPNGTGMREVTVISNLDFNDFSGFTTWQVNGAGEDGMEEVRQYVNIMVLGNSDSGELSRIAADCGLESVPETPAGDEPGFVVIGGDDAEALQAVVDMHELYRVEGGRMRTARIARDAAYQARKEYLLANPPKPEDVTIRVWRRDSSEIRLPQGGGVQ